MGIIANVVTLPNMPTIIKELLECHTHAHSTPHQISKYASLLVLGGKYVHVHIITFISYFTLIYLLHMSKSRAHIFLSRWCYLLRLVYLLAIYFFIKLGQCLLTSSNL